MKKLMILGALLSTVAVAPVGFAANAPDADPVDGIYRVTELAAPQTAHSCKFGDDAGSFFPDLAIVNNGDGTYTQDYLVPGTDISICDQPGNICDNLECTIDGKTAHCGGGEPLVVDFGVFGFDAVVTFGAAHSQGNSAHSFWPRNTVHMSMESSFLECEGADCELFGMLSFGPEFSFPCGDVQTVIRYELE